MVLENVPQEESMHEHVSDPRICYFIRLGIGSPWSFVKGLFWGHALARLYLSCAISAPNLSYFQSFLVQSVCYFQSLFLHTIILFQSLLLLIFLPSHHHCVQSLCYFQSPLHYIIGPFQWSTNNLPSIKHPFNSPSFTPSVLPSIPWPFGHP